MSSLTQPWDSTRTYYVTKFRHSRKRVNNNWAVLKNEQGKISLDMDIRTRLNKSLVPNS